MRYEREKAQKHPCIFKQIASYSAWLWQVHKAGFFMEAINPFS
jgi:hypothetical protein